MHRPRTLPAFTTDEFQAVHRLLATQVVYMMGRKLEEGDWAAVYCQAKQIPNVGWSNLNIDVVHQGVGVEHKMLRQPAHVRLQDVCGTTLMHPALTRSIRVPSTEAEPNEVMAEILNQYAAFIAARRAKVAESRPGVEPDLRTGWLLWKANLQEFLYFEEETIAPDPGDYTAEWKASGGGSRKASKNLWVYEKETGRKRYSITTSAGAKIQPYFDVPPPNDPNIYIFRVQGEELENGLVRIWVAAATARELHRIAGDLSVETLSLVISEAAIEPNEGTDRPVALEQVAQPITLTAEAYALLNAAFPGVSDEHMIQLLLQRLKKESP